MSSEKSSQRGKRLDAHLFICTNLREGARDSCAARGSVALRDAAKAMSQQPERGWKGRVRINASGCLGRCEQGIAAVLYPQGEWLTGLSSGSLSQIEKAIGDALENHLAEQCPEA